ncbi:GNAT family N-acetyltransferase [Alkalicoccus chagannorensis]|uniref:GNAT family N-acetyltransferase n=1 Tax=Alkalicoccus chagannorensis TaxID=427072 RepID=UPI0004220D6E|nr:GNAT family N-acetyltransferase [Alkalicoccus chagannorensis]
MFCRRAVPEDAKEIQDIAVQSWHDTYEDLIPRDVQQAYLDKVYHEEKIIERMKESNLFICEKAGRTIGFAAFFYETPTSAEVSAIYVLPGAQREGVGSALMEHLWSHMQNVRDVYVDVEAGNEKAETFYTARGFKKEAEFQEDIEGYRLPTIRLRLRMQ